MRIESRVPQFLGRVRTQFAAAIDDAGEEARHRPGAPSDTHGEVTGPLTGRIVSNKPGARAQERGAYITPKRARALRFADGTFSMHARIRGKHYLRKTGRRWGRILVPRLRGV